MKTYKLTVRISGEVTIKLRSDDEDEVIIDAEDIFTNATIPITIRKRKGVLEVQDVDIEEVEET